MAGFALAGHPGRVRCPYCGSSDCAGMQTTPKGVVMICCTTGRKMTDAALRRSLANPEPILFWRKVPEITRDRLMFWVDGESFDVWLDVAKRSAHYSYGYRIAAWRSGAGPGGCAGFVQGFGTIAAAKDHVQRLWRAEQMARQSRDPSTPLATTDARA